MVTGGTIAGLLAVAFQWDEVRLPKLLCCSVPTVLLAVLQRMHDPSLPIILKLHTKHLLPALKIYRRLSSMTSSAPARAISTGHLQVSFSKVQLWLHWGACGTTRFSTLMWVAHWRVQVGSISCPVHSGDSLRECLGCPKSPHGAPLQQSQMLCSEAS